MKHSSRTWFILGLCLLAASSPLLAQPDSLTAADTIHLSKRRYFLSTLREYSYHYANHLADTQVLPLLQLSPNPSVRRLVKSGRLVRGIGVGMTAVGFPVMVAGLLTPRQRVETGSTLLLTGLGLFYGASIPFVQSRRQFQRAVTVQNQFLRRRADDYYAPVVLPFAQLAEPTLTDTVAIKKRGLGHQYTYRNVRLAPARQLQRLTDRLNDTDVKQGMQYTRRVGAIGGFVGGIGSTFLTTSLLFYGIQRANGNSTQLGTPLFWGSVAAITVNYGLRIHAGRVQFRTVQALNERLRSQYGAPGRSEHFPNP